MAPTLIRPRRPPPPAWRGRGGVATTKRAAGTLQSRADLGQRKVAAAVVPGAETHAARRSRRARPSLGGTEGSKGMGGFVMRCSQSQMLAKYASHVSAEARKAAQ